MELGCYDGRTSRAGTILDRIEVGLIVVSIGCLSGQRN